MGDFVYNITTLSEQKCSMLIITCATSKQMRCVRKGDAAGYNNICNACMYMRYTCKYGYEREKERDSYRGLVLWYARSIRSNLVGDFVITTAIIITIINNNAPSQTPRVCNVRFGWLYTHHDEHYNNIIIHGSNVVYIMCDSVMHIRRNRKQYDCDTVYVCYFMGSDGPFLSISAR